MDILQKKFIDDAGDLIIKLETNLLQLEKDSTNRLLIAEVFRIMHTLKGTAGMYGFDEVGEITHQLESIYDFIRSGVFRLNEEIISLSLKSADDIKCLLKPSEKARQNCHISYNINLNHAREIIKRISEIENDSKFSEGDYTDESIENQLVNNDAKLYYIIYKPEKDILRRGVNPLSIFDDIEDIGQYKAKVHLCELPELQDIIYNDVYIFWEIVLSSSHDLDGIEYCFLFFMETEYQIIELNNDNPLETNGLHDLLNNLNSSLKKSEISLSVELFDIENCSHSKAIPDKEIPKTHESNEIQITETSTEIAKPIFNSDKEFSIRVSSGKLDELMNLVSELVTTKAQLKLIAETIESEQLNKVVENIELLTKRFRDNALDIRLIPVHSIIVNLRRLVRDLSSELGKEVDFITEGIETELDKTIITNLESPLMHIIRNCMGHGIEDKETRLAAGKSPIGMIRFIAFYSGANVLIQIQDDGRGINPELIRRKAIERGFITADKVLDSREMFDLIVQPGFSTAAEITGISGRGVGMDGVKRSINELRGELEIDSEVGLGTSVTLKLPLTLSIMDTLQVSIGSQFLLIPLSVIDNCEIEQHQVLFNKRNHRIEYNNKLIPFIYLRDEFNIAGTPPKKEKIVTIKQNDKYIALIVDQVIGEHQAVLKPLGPMFRQQDFFSGASILGDGSLALVIDVDKLIKFKSNTTGSKIVESYQ